MPAERRNAILLGALAVALIAVGVYQFRVAQGSSRPTDGGAASAAGRQARNAAGPTAPAVHLDALRAEHPKPDAAERNPFRFKPKPLPPPPPPPKPAQGAAGPGQPLNAQGPPPTPISNTLKFIGIVESPQRSLRVAILSDGKHVYYGREGEAVLGQYRILKIGAESIEMAYLDGRGRQTIRLSGS